MFSFALKTFMIITRYFAKEVYSAVFAVTCILVLVFLLNQTIRFLTQAATGHIPSSLVLNLIFLELPYLWGLLLPLGLYLGILITYSRFYADQEMTVLFASGMSHRQLLAMTLFISSFVALMVSLLMFELNPYLAQKKNNMMAATSTKNLVSALVPGAFKISENGHRVIYIGGVSRDHKKAENLFVAESAISSSLNEKSTNWVITSAESASQERNNLDGRLFVVAKNGYRYQGVPGQQDFSVSLYHEYGIEIPEEEGLISQDKDAIPTWTLIKNSAQSLNLAVELQWRMALPISVILLGILAQLLSKVAPRQGRFQRLLPALLIYIVYANLIFVGRSWMLHEQVPAALGLWWAHGLLLLLILFLYFRQRSL